MGVSRPPSHCACALLLRISVLCVDVRTPSEHQTVSPAEKSSVPLSKTPPASRSCLPGPQAPLCGSVLPLRPLLGAWGRGKEVRITGGLELCLLFLTVTSAQTFTIRAWTGFASDCWREQAVTLVMDKQRINKRAVYGLFVAIKSIQSSFFYAASLKKKKNL